MGNFGKRDSAADFFSFQEHRVALCWEFPLGASRSLMCIGLRPTIRKLKGESAPRILQRNKIYQMSPFSLLKYVFLIWNASFRALLSLSIMGFLTFWPTGMAQESVSTDPVELQALFEVMTGINSDTDWRTQLPDPCLGSQQGIYCLPDNVGVYHVTNLEFGFISDYDNLIACSGNANLHPSIAQLQFLETLFIYNCFVNGSATVPTEIGRLSNSLQMLTLHGNSALGGALPSELGNLTSLQRVVLTENSFEGVIPEQLGNLHGLLQLELSENRLHGPIPGSLNSLQSLVILDLSCNVLSGDLPPLDGLTGLQQLVLSNNNLSGSIPEAFGSLSSLTYLDLSRNNLSGDIPPSFSNLSRLQDLFLEGNHMQSPLPEFVGGMLALSRLNLAESGFLGEVPQSLGGLVNLRVLLLQGNSFSGHIPSSLGRLPNVYQMDLSSNNLTGPVPFLLAFVKELGTNLILSNNLGLCIPPANAREAVATLGVSICADCSSLGNSGRHAHSPKSAPASGQLQLNDGSKRFQMTYTYLMAYSAIAIWLISSSFGEFHDIVSSGTQTTFVDGELITTFKVPTVQENIRGIMSQDHFGEHFFRDVSLVSPAIT